MTTSTSERSVVIPMRNRSGPDERVPRASHELPAQPIGPCTMWATSAIGNRAICAPSKAHPPWAAPGVALAQPVFPFALCLQAGSLRSAWISFGFMIALRLIRTNISAKFESCFAPGYETGIGGPLSKIPGELFFFLSQQRISGAVEDRVKVSIQPVEDVRLFFKYIFAEAQTFFAHWRAHGVLIGTYAIDKGIAANSGSQNFTKHPEPPCPFVAKLLKMDSAYLATPAPCWRLRVCCPGCRSVLHGGRYLPKTHSKI